MSSLENKLAAFKKVQSGSVTSRKVSNTSQNTFTTSNVNQLNEMVYGQNMIPNQNGSTPYDAKQDLKRLQEGFTQEQIENGKNRLPSKIFESIINNPLNDISVDPQMDSFTEQLSRKINGIDKATHIIEQLNEVDNAKKQERIEEQRQSNNSVGTIDYEMLKMVVENAVSKKFDELKSSLLNESANHNSSPNLKAMKLTENFLFLDSDDNVYECKMIYKGKNKKKKQ